MSNFYTIEHLGDNATDEQLVKLREITHRLLRPGDIWQPTLEDQALELADEILDQCDPDMCLEHINEELLWAIEDMLFEHIDRFVQHGLLPETDGHAHDELSEVVTEEAERLLSLAEIDEEDMWVMENNIPTEPNPPCKYDV